MPNKFNYLIIAIGLVVMSLSCTKDSINPDGTDDISPAKVSQTLSAGEWVITHFFDSDKDETDHYNGYVFTFNTDGKLLAAKGSSVTTGSWTQGSDDSQTKLIIDFSTPEDLEELSEDWRVLERTDSKVRLQHVSGGNGGTDLLTFEKKS